jgi:methionyl aminopeptidase
MDSPLQKILDALASQVFEGQTGEVLDKQAACWIEVNNCRPAFLNYKPGGFDDTKLGPPFPATLCVSINNEVIHGIPDSRKFQWGDVVSLDLGLVRSTTAESGLIVDEYDDGAVTVAVDGSALARRLIKATKEALDAGCAMAKPGNTIFDISRAIKAVADRERFSVIKGYGGHGIGSQLHMPPHIPNEPVGDDAPLETGMRIAIEPMFSTNHGDVYTASNKWTVKVRSGLAAHFERTVTI